MYADWALNTYPDCRDSGWSTEFFKQLSEGFFLLGGHVKDPALAGTLQEAAAILSDQCDCLLTDGGESDCDSAYCPHDQPQRYASALNTLPSQCLTMLTQNSRSLGPDNLFLPPLPGRITRPHAQIVPEVSFL